MKDIDHDAPEEEMTVTIETEDGEVTECAVLTILETLGRDYIVLMPLNLYDNIENLNEDDAFVWFYRYSENPDDPNEEPELSDIEDDEEFEAVSDAFDEYLDNLDFEDME
ncbi:MAG: DUF1292 domain-containing protein [Lachnospiraceae bacterium]|nr:DUF1292 domain-containing protein [Lachnospiraceae bacterium]